MQNLVLISLLQTVFVLFGAHPFISGPCLLVSSYPSSGLIWARHGSVVNHWWQSSSAACWPKQLLSCAYNWMHLDYYLKPILLLMQTDVSTSVCEQCTDLRPNAWFPLIRLELCLERPAGECSPTESWPIDLYEWISKVVYDDDRSCVCVGFVLLVYVVNFVSHVAIVWIFPPLEIAL